MVEVIRGILKKEVIAGNSTDDSAGIFGIV